ncbi:carbon-nitrogen hydrolase family protein [Tomitella fengzijianii]|uniref:Carbon-nitrogen hydrolase family protein n=1 Tax=Tomitella fengzijianii TaxID=2597660 RepID=A0A516X248_9ACTN|nr:carbon-nitrogen hydrolase family protein [Tomitella fengzijianii]QDQ97148.1 carbon-nitrogen hydrolase family protein [Tomitella fengzijianii]
MTGGERASAPGPARSETVLAAAVQLDARIADVDHNLRRCEELADDAGARGARIIALPEFFTTGIAFEPALSHAALPPGGSATALLQRLAVRHHALVGGSFLCRDDDGEVRNAYFLAGPDGALLGRHDKDLPTMWENSFYIGGGDPGLIGLPPDAFGGMSAAPTAGAAVCWELMRTGTARRLRGRVDLMMTGSGWWTVPQWRPRGLFERWEARNEATARRAAADFSRYVGAPLVHAAHCGPVDCRMPWTPLRYRGRLEGATLIADSHGHVLAERTRDEGPGVVTAPITVGRTRPGESLPRRYWLHRRGPLPTAAWHYQRAHGRGYYAAHTRTPAEEDREWPRTAVR